MNIEQTKPNKLLRIADVSTKTTIAKSTINLWVTQGKFPKPLMLSSTVKVWREPDIDDWIDEKSKEQT
jgi:prophage regulatory protein